MSSLICVCMVLSQSHLSRLESSLNTSDIYYRRMALCNSLAGNPCDVITITAQPRRRDAKSVEILSKATIEIFAVSLFESSACALFTRVLFFVGSRPYIFLTSRVHPGESNSSWVMKGIILVSKGYFFLFTAHARTIVRGRFFQFLSLAKPSQIINMYNRLDCRVHRKEEKHLKVYMTEFFFLEQVFMYPGCQRLFIRGWQSSSS